MTLVEWLLALFLIGLGYAFWHVRVTLRRYRSIRARLEDGLLRHVTTGDFRRALTDLAIAVLLLAIVALPLAIPLVGPRWFAFLQQSAFILLGAIFVLGMAFARLHELHQPE